MHVVYWGEQRWHAIPLSSWGEISNSAHQYLIQTQILALETAGRRCRFLLRNPREAEDSETQSSREPKTEAEN